jgi:hypothetical protein
MKQTDKTGTERTLGVTVIAVIWLAGATGRLVANSPAGQPGAATSPKNK